MRSNVIYLDFLDEIKFMGLYLFYEFLWGFQEIVWNNVREFLFYRVLKYWKMILIILILVLVFLYFIINSFLKVFEVKKLIVSVIIEVMSVKKLVNLIQML